MKKRLPLLAMLTAMACTKPDSDSVIVVSVTAPADMPAAVQLRATFAYGGNTETELFPAANATGAISFAPATFVLTMPPARTGGLGIVVDALDVYGNVVGHGEGAVFIVAGGRADVAVALSTVPAGNPDAGVPDTAVPGPDTAKADKPIADAPWGAETRRDVAGATGGAGGVRPGTGGAGTGGKGGGGAGGSSGCTPNENQTCFANGKANGAVNGYGYIALGALDTVTSPVCDNTLNGGGAAEPITKDQPCPEEGGMTTWKGGEALCLSGTIPVVTGGDFASNWGVQIGMNVTEPPGGTLARRYRKVTFTFNASAVVPTNTAIRAVVHRQGDDLETSYCATLISGASVSLTAFNTECWDGTGVDLSEEDIPNIDRIAIQISSDDRKEYKVSDFCLTGILFDDPIGGTGGRMGTGGSAGAGGVTGSGGSPPVVDCTDTSTFSGSVTEQYGSMQISVDGNPNKSYYVYANWWGSPFNNQVETISGIGFKMTNPGNVVTSQPHTPLGFPSLFIGSYQNKTSKGSNLPKQVSTITSVPTILATNVDSVGNYTGFNAAYDVWLTASSSPLSGSASTPGAGGAYLMVWLFKPSDEQPRGSVLANGREIPGVSGAWTVWLDNASDPPCVSYVGANKPSSLEFDLNYFLQDAIKNKYGVTAEQYLSIIFAGFEVWGGGDGLQVKRFCADVK